MTVDPTFAAAQAAYARRDYEAVMRLLLPQIERSDAGEPVLALLANAALLARSDATAIPLLERLVALRPQNAQYRRILSQAMDRNGTVLRRAGRLDEAERSLESACALWPDNDTARFNLAALLGQRRAFASALPHWRTLSARLPDDPDVQIELADCLAVNDHAAEARRRLTGLPGAADMTPARRLRLAQAWAHAGETHEAQSALTRLVPAPDHFRQLMALGDTLAQAGDVPAAQVGYRLASRSLDGGRQAPGLRAELAARLALPAVYAGIEDLHAHRARYRANVGELASALPPDALSDCEANLSQLARTNFFLAYQGEDDVEPQSAYGRWLSQTAPSFAPDIAGKPTGSGQRRARIGLVGSIFRYCTAGSYFGSWVRLLAELGHEVHVFQLGPAFDGFTGTLERSAARLHRIETDLNTFARTLFDSKCDLLVYPEIGMEARMLPLAALRLAPRQACAWGHPVTTGLPTIDGYFSCAEMEPADATSHYSEPLLLLPGLGTDYARPALPEAAARRQLGLPDDRRLYLFPHALYKLHPDNDAVMIAVAARDPDGLFVMFRSEARAALAPFRRRVDAAFARAGLAPDRHLLILPMASRDRFLQIVACCDVMIDSLHWSGGNTSLDALLSAVPLVTCPGRFMRSRQSAAMLRRLGLDELIVDTPDRLAALAVEIATSPGRRIDVSGRIRTHLPDLFDTTQLCTTLGDHVERLLSR